MAEYAKRSKCVVKQYDKCELFPGHFVSGEQTLAENLADTGGLKVAYWAYVEEAGGEAVARAASGMLPGYTDEQLFFLAYGQSWCQVISREHALENLANDEHAPPPFRTNVPLSTFAEFHRAFKCPLGSRMRPADADQCKVWCASVASINSAGTCNPLNEPANAFPPVRLDTRLKAFDATPIRPFARERTAVLFNDTVYFIGSLAADQDSVSKVFSLQMVGYEQQYIAYAQLALLTSNRADPLASFFSASTTDPSHLYQSYYPERALRLTLDAFSPRQLSTGLHLAVWSEPAEGGGDALAADLRLYDLERRSLLQLDVAELPANTSRTQGDVCGTGYAIFQEVRYGAAGAGGGGRAVVESAVYVYTHGAGRPEAMASAKRRATYRALAPKFDEHVDPAIGHTQCTSKFGCGAVEEALESVGCTAAWLETAAALELNEDLTTTPAGPLLPTDVSLHLLQLPSREKRVLAPRDYASGAHTALVSYLISEGHILIVLATPDGSSYVLRHYQLSSRLFADVPGSASSAPLRLADSHGGGFLVWQTGPGGAPTALYALHFSASEADPFHRLLCKVADSPAASPFLSATLYADTVVWAQRDEAGAVALQRLDLDKDNDDAWDAVDAFPLLGTEQWDSDNDGVGDSEDLVAATGPCVMDPVRGACWSDYKILYLTWGLVMAMLILGTAAVVAIEAWWERHVARVTAEQQAMKEAREAERRAKEERRERRRQRRLERARRRAKEQGEALASVAEAGADDGETEGRPGAPEAEPDIHVVAKGGLEPPAQDSVSSEGPPSAGGKGAEAEAEAVRGNGAGGAEGGAGRRRGAPRRCGARRQRRAPWRCWRRAPPPPPPPPPPPRRPPPATAPPTPSRPGAPAGRRPRRRRGAGPAGAAAEQGQQGQGPSGAGVASGPSPTGAEGKSPSAAGDGSSGSSDTTSSGEEEGEGGGKDARRRAKARRQRRAARRGERERRQKQGRGGADWDRIEADLEEKAGGRTQRRVQMLLAETSFLKRNYSIKPSQTFVDRKRRASAEEQPPLHAAPAPAPAPAAVAAAADGAGGAPTEEEVLRYEMANPFQGPIEKVSLAVQVFLVLLTLASVAVAFVPLYNYEPLAPRTEQALAWFDFFTTTTFMVDFVARYVMRDRGATPGLRSYVWANKWDIPSLIPDIPGVADAGFLSFLVITRLTRLLRILRVFRLFRLVRLYHRLTHASLLVILIVERPIMFLSLVTVLVVLLASVILKIVEQDTNEGFRDFGNVVWYTLVTQATIGYGDYKAGTGFGRAISMANAMLGIGLLGALSGKAVERFLTADASQAKRIRSARHAQQKTLYDEGCLRRLWDIRNPLSAVLPRDPLAALRSAGALAPSEAGGGGPPSSGGDPRASPAPSRGAASAVSALARLGRQPALRPSPTPAAREPPALPPPSPMGAGPEMVPREPSPINKQQADRVGFPTRAPGDSETTVSGGGGARPRVPSETPLPERPVSPGGVSATSGAGAVGGGITGRVRKLVARASASWALGNDYKDAAATPLDLLRKLMRSAGLDSRRRSGLKGSFADFWAELQRIVFEPPRQNELAIEKLFTMLHHQRAGDGRVPLPYYDLSDPLDQREMRLDELLAKFGVDKRPDFDDIRDQVLTVLLLEERFQSARWCLDRLRYRPLATWHRPLVEPSWAGPPPRLRIARFRWRRAAVTVRAAPGAGEDWDKQPAERRGSLPRSLTVSRPAALGGAAALTASPALSPLLAPAEPARFTVLPEPGRDAGLSKSFRIPFSLSFARRPSASPAPPPPAPSSSIRPPSLESGMGAPGAGGPGTAAHTPEGSLQNGNALPAAEAAAALPSPHLSARAGPRPAGRVQTVAEEEEEDEAPDLGLHVESASEEEEEGDGEEAGAGPLTSKSRGSGSHSGKSRGARRLPSAGARDEQQQQAAIPGRIASLEEAPGGDAPSLSPPPAPGIRHRAPRPAPDPDA
eukprot:tig00020554_g10946.t1